MSVENGGRAFPLQYEGSQGSGTITQYGMTMRDYFAAKAMPVIMADLIQRNTEAEAADFAAVIAYKLADAMLRERAR